MNHRKIAKEGAQSEPKQSHPRTRISWTIPLNSPFLRGCLSNNSFMIQISSKIHMPCFTHPWTLLDISTRRCFWKCPWRMAPDSWLVRQLIGLTMNICARGARTILHSPVNPGATCQHYRISAKSCDIGWHTSLLLAGIERQCQLIRPLVSCYYLTKADLRARISRAPVSS